MVRSRRARADRLDHRSHGRFVVVEKGQGDHADQEKIEDQVRNGKEPSGRGFGILRGQGLEDEEPARDDGRRHHDHQIQAHAQPVGSSRSFRPEPGRSRPGNRDRPADAARPAGASGRSCPGASRSSIRATTELIPAISMVMASMRQTGDQTGFQVRVSGPTKGHAGGHPGDDRPENAPGPGPSR